MLTHDLKELSEWIANPTIKHGSSSIMIWGCMFINEPGLIYRIEGSLNYYGYQKKLENK